MMMLKALSAIALSALPVQSAHDTWILHKKDTWFGSPEIPCRRADDIGDLPELENKVKGKKLIGWTIKLPTSTIDTDKSFTGAVNKHEPRFVCVGKKNEIFYYHEDGTCKGSGVYFTAEGMEKVVARPLGQLAPKRLAGMGYTVLDQYLAEYIIRTKAADKKDAQLKRFYLFFASWDDWKAFHNKLEGATGYKLVQEVSEPEVVKQLNALLAQVNDALLGDANAMNHLKDNLGFPDTASARFFMAAMSAKVNGGQALTYLDQTSGTSKYVYNHRVTSGNIGSLIDNMFTKPGLKRNLKKYLGLKTKKRRRRMSTMQRLLDAERAFSS